MKNKATVLCIFASSLLYSSAIGQRTSNLVPDAATAIKIAEAVWMPIYGNEILKKRPYRAILQGDTLWIVKGTLAPVRHFKDGSIRVTVGGIPYAYIQKENGRILSVTHTK
ncbi:MAG: hypothetical protein EOP52_05610 [Sphingobacteriales bacterium]|nr:MAG: hypothetical protein EOP52_05610 [Sphingobacteriales bacterium]